MIVTKSEVLIVGTKKGVPHRTWRYEEKIHLVKLALEKNVSPKQLHREHGVNTSLIYVWCSLYKQHGANGLCSKSDRRRIMHEGTNHGIEYT